jgi:Beta-propeller repeat/Cep192 domain 4
MSGRELMGDLGQPVEPPRPSRGGRQWLFGLALAALGAELALAFSLAPRIFRGVAGESTGLLATVARHSAPAAASVSGAQADRLAVLRSYGRLPLSFEPNEGQTGAPVKFLARAGGYTLFLTPSEAVFSFSQPRSSRRSAFRGKSAGRRAASWLGMELVGGNRSAVFRGLDELPGKSNYFLGNTPKNWRLGIPNYARVVDEQVYPGVDLVFRGNPQRLEYDFIIAPGANPRIIAMTFPRAETLRFDRAGNVNLRVAGRSFLLHKPEVYQRIGGAKRVIAAGFTLRGPKQVAFRIAAYDSTQPLIIDPTVSPILGYSTYLGGTKDDIGTGIAVDSSGNAYIAGYTDSTDIFPSAVVGAGFQTSLAGGLDAFVVKLNSGGTALLYATYVGGKTPSLGEINADDRAQALAIDSSGNAYITGDTASSDFPTLNPLSAQSCGQGGADVFVTKLNPTGSGLVFSTCLGGAQDDHGLGIALDSSNNVFVTGDTASSTTFPTTTGAFQTTFGGGATDAFVTEIKADGSALLYSTFLGGSGDDHARGIAVDSSGNAYVAGNTASSNFPISTGATAAFQGTFQGSGAFGLGDGFVTKLNPAGTGSSDLVYSTYLGGANDDVANSITVDSSGKAYVTGLTFSSRFPTANPYQASLAGGDDAFIAKLDPSASGSASLVYSTYVGGKGADQGGSIAVDSAGNAYVIGVTNSFDFPIAGAFQTTNNSLFSSAFYVKLAPAGNALVHSSFLGGSDANVGRTIAIDSSGNAYLSGNTTSADFPTTTGAFETGFGGTGSASIGDAFVTKVLPSPTVTSSPSTLSFGNVDAGSSSSSMPTTLTNTGDASLSITNIAANGPFSESNNCPATLSVAANCTINVVFTPIGVGSTNGSVSITDNAGGSPQSISITGSGLGFALSATSTSQQVSPGGTATYSLTITPNGFTGPVSLSCIGAPAQSTCAISPSSVSLDGSTAVALTVTVKTSAKSSLPPNSAPRSWPPQLPIWLPLLAGILTLGLAGLAWRKRRLAPLGLAAALLLFSAGFGCTLGSSSPGTPKGTYTLQATGTSGGFSRGLALTLTVQ